jgi:hypothetical protein
VAETGVTTGAWVFGTLQPPTAWACVPGVGADAMRSSLTPEECGVGAGGGGGAGGAARKEVPDEDGGGGFCGTGR